MRDLMRISCGDQAIGFFYIHVAEGREKREKNELMSYRTLSLCRSRSVIV